GSDVLYTLSLHDALPICAEALLGMGDMLYLAPGTGLPVRVHGAFVADDEVHKVVDHLKKIGPPDYIEGILAAPEDDLEAALGSRSEEHTSELQSRENLVC